MDADLATRAELTPESRGLRERPTEWWLEFLAIPKSASYAECPPYAPSYRRGWSLALPESATLTVEPFVRSSGEPAVAVVWHDPADEFVVAWFAGARAAEAHKAVEHLNAEIRAVWRHWRRVQPSSTESD